MKISIAAKSRSGHVWMEMWLSASTTTPDTPPFGVKWWKWLCRIVAPGHYGRLAQRVVDHAGIVTVAGAPEIHEKMRAGKFHAVLLDEIILSSSSTSAKGLQLSGSRSGNPRPSPVG